MKKVATLLLVLVAATALVACGGSDDDTSSAPAETSEATTGGGGGAQSTPANVLAFEAAAGTDLAYTSDSAQSSAGKISIEFTNPQAASHDVAIEDSSGKEIAGTELVADGKATTTANLEPGDYTFFCTVPGHREAGMEGTLTVK